MGESAAALADRRSPGPMPEATLIYEDARGLALRTVLKFDKVKRRPAAIFL